ncbi:MAG TPA: thiol reductant ABC exporter subunit CydD [Verrucomicrobiae bacterium]|nr:thiol reductant ABC exporter subunit CydD [Verrucomicrobiae bacterium]
MAQQNEPPVPGPETAAVAAEKWLREHAVIEKNLLLVTVGLSLCAGLLLVLQARLLAGLCHAAVISHSPLSPLIPSIAGVAAAGALRALLLYLSERCGLKAAARIKHRVRTRLYRRMLEPAAAPGDTAVLAETVTAGVDGIEPYVARYLPQVATAALVPAAVLCFVFPFEWRSGLLMLLSAPFIPLFMVLIGKGAEELNRRQWGGLTAMAAHLLDLVQGLADLKIFGAVDDRLEGVRRVSQEYRRGTMSVLRIAFLSALVLEFFSTVSTAVIAVLVGFRLLSGKLPLADGLFVLLLAPEFYLPLRSLGLHYHARMQGTAAAAAILPLLRLPLHQEQGGGEIPGGPLTIRFHRVSYSYGPGRGLPEVDLEIPHGRITALAGASGAGKSTVVRLLLGFLPPTSGVITVNGRDLAGLNLREWRRRLAWVPQQPFFFAASIRENLLLAHPEAKETELAEALEAAGAATFVSRLPRGLDTVLGEQGAGLSGGELRRLALARACLRKAPLLVLDEPTAGLDPESERLVGEALTRLTSRCAILLVSHREDTLALAGRVYLLDGGGA